MQLDAFQHGTGRVADLVAVIAFLVAAHPAMRAEIGALVEKLRTMMRRHERRRTGGGGGGQRRRKEKQPGKRATARAAAQEASAATGLADSCIAQVGEWTEAGVKRLLVGRTVVLLASEYGDADDGTSAAADDDADEETFKAVVTSVESDAAGVVFVWAKHADASTERMTAADAVAHIEPLNALPLERLAAMPKRLLVAECRARGLPHSNKVQQKLAELLTAEFARLRDALPEDEAEEGEHAQAQTQASQQSAAPFQPPLQLQQPSAAASAVPQKVGARNVLHGGRRWTTQEDAVLKWGVVNI